MFSCTCVSLRCVEVVEVAKRVKYTLIFRLVRMVFQKRISNGLH